MTLDGKMTTRKQIDVAKLVDLLAACHQVVELPDLRLTADARRARDALREELDKLTEGIAELADWTD
jgi:hypothetical protein